MTRSHVPLLTLVVDENEDTAQSTALFLTLSGYRTLVAASADEAIEIATSEPPDVAFVDIHMPKMNGWALALRLKEAASGEKPFVVAVTACGSDADKARSAAAGIVLHLVKPAEPERLVQILECIAKFKASNCRGRCELTAAFGDSRSPRGSATHA